MGRGDGLAAAERGSAGASRPARPHRMPSPLFTIPHGPVRSGVFESVEYLVETPGEDIPLLRVRPYAKHRGLQKRFEGLDPADGVLLAERVEGIASVAHALAFTHALEAPAQVRVPRPPRWCGCCTPSLSTKRCGSTSASQQDLALAHAGYVTYVAQAAARSHRAVYVRVNVTGGDRRTIVPGPAHPDRDRSRPVHRRQGWSLAGSTAGTCSCDRCVAWWRHSITLAAVGPVDAVDDVVDQRRLGVQGSPRLRLVLHLAVAAVDRPERIGDLPARGKTVVDESADEVGQPVSVLGGDHNLDASRWRADVLVHGALLFFMRSSAVRHLARSKAARPARWLQFGRYRRPIHSSFRPQVSMACRGHTKKLSHSPHTIAFPPAG